MSEMIDRSLLTLQDYFEYKWNLMQTREDITKVVFTQSRYLSLEEDKRKELSAGVEELFIQFANSIETELHTTV